MKIKKDKLPVLWYLPKLIEGRYVGVTDITGDKCSVLYYPASNSFFGLFNIFRKMCKIRNIPFKATQNDIIHPDVDEPGIDPNGYKIIAMGPNGERGLIEKIEGFELKNVEQLQKQIARLKMETHFQKGEIDNLEKGATKRMEQLKASKEIFEPEYKKRKKGKQPYISPNIEEL